MKFSLRPPHGLLVYLALCSFAGTNLPAITVALNEVMASNDSTLSDEDGDFTDWIELINWGDSEVSLEGWGLSDDYDRPFRWVFPSVTLQPGKFLLVRASGKDRRQAGQPLHTSFSISAAGEEVLLTHPDGQRIDTLTPRAIPTGLSAGRQPDGIGDWFFFTAPTPGTSNTTAAYESLIPAPVFSRSEGFYQTGFDLELSSVQGSVILYTLDGSEPDPAYTGGATYTVMNDYPDGPLLQKSFSSLTYEGPIQLSSRVGEPNTISEITSAFNGFFRPGSEWELPDGEVLKASVVRARAFKQGSIPSPVITKTYFIGEDIDHRHSLPVVTLATTEKGLFDYNDGIYVPGRTFADWRKPRPTARVSGSTPANYQRSGPQWELPAHISLFEPGGELAFSQNVGIRIHGGWSRAHRQKALRVYARNEYDENSSVAYPLFPGHQKQGGGGELADFKRFILHNSGQDNGLTMFRDAMAQSLIAHTGIDTQAYRPVVVYLNGEYWGIHNIRERYNHHYVATNYDLDPDEIVILEANASLVEGLPADRLHYTQLQSYTATQATNGTINQPGILETIEAGMDLDNLIHHYSAQIYYSNIDWPLNNLRWWRYKGEPDPDRHGHDGRWRWMLYDTDHGFGLFVTDGWGGYNNDYRYDTVAHALSKGQLLWSNPLWATSLFRSLLVNDAFRERFINTFADHLNSSFKPERIIPRIDEMQAVLAPEYPEHARRWNQPSTFWDGGDTWEEKVQVLRDFANNRIPYIRQHLDHHFSLGGTGSVTVDISPESTGQVRVNTLTIAPGEIGMGNNPYPWTGTYFRNVPITLSAEPGTGYRFLEWRDPQGQTFANTPTLSLDPFGQTSLVAVFRAEGGFKAWRSTAFPDPEEYADLTISGPTADPFGHGISNLMRYALNIPVGTNPRSYLPQTEIEAQGLSLLFIRDPHKTDIVYLVEASSDLYHWDEILYDSRLDQQPNNAGDAMRIRDPEPLEAHPERFLRLRILLSPSMEESMLKP